MVSKPSTSLADVLERQRRERAALDALGLSGRADEVPLDLHKLAVIVADLLAAQPGKRRP